MIQDSFTVSQDHINTNMWKASSSLAPKLIGGVTVIKLTSVDHWFKPQSDQTKDYQLLHH